MTEFKGKLDDLLDKLEDRAWNHDDSYMINEIRSRIDDLCERLPEEHQELMKKHTYDEDIEV